MSGQTIHVGLLNPCEVLEYIDVRATLMSVHVCSNSELHWVRGVGLTKFCFAVMGLRTPL
jgi:hypothetical protein